ncbi:hypothetical protein I6F30_25475 [Bradyrhizobium sp. NBAIM20]|uniref:hypothetical protein n=1 Tax=unclassified Bradyrhizobium TaxID=2631580 RepID=UPI001CD5FAB2|nr:MULTISPECIES: hypothetical protein [unclassified Bradyrhizobium]MCA1414477.1 hypothetical protein [Bradyrhizobium sp. NBAIM20]MCA1459861.1 hypothetical protein [Bradyrhizobium sp. NBAIM18]MCA1514556.1 hypothetical protein [Bradyrhizobium sp. NBAIM01]
MPLASAAAAAVLALQLATPAAIEGETPNLVQVREGPCSHGYDIDVYGRCYPNGAIPRQYQAARQGYDYDRPRRYYREEYRPRWRHRYYRDDY